MAAVARFPVSVIAHPFYSIYSISQALLHGSSLRHPYAAYRLISKVSAILKLEAAGVLASASPAGSPRTRRTRHHHAP